MNTNNFNALPTGSNRKIKKLKKIGSRKSKQQRLSTRLTKQTAVAMPPQEILSMQNNPYNYMVTSFRGTANNALYYREVTDKMYQLYHNHLQQYIYSLLAPELAASENIHPRQPSPMPVPSCTFTVRNNFTWKTNPLVGDTPYEYLIWLPNYLRDTDNVPQQGASNILHFDHYSNQVGQITALTGFFPSADFSQYRLVSACMEVKCTSNQFVKEGMIHACAFVDRRILPRDTGSVDLTAQPAYVEIPNVNNMVNGISPIKVALNGDAAIKSIHIPLDPSDQLFYDMGTYYGYKPGAATPMSHGAHLDYVVALYKGQEQNALTFNVAITANYELIPSIKTAAMFPRSTSSPLDQYGFSLAKQVVDMGTNDTPNNILKRIGTVLKKNAPLIRDLIKTGVSLFS